MEIIVEEKEKIPEQLSRVVGAGRNEFFSIYSVNGVVQSFEPAEGLFGFTPHAHLVPPYRPDRVLMLGYGCGQVAKLVEKVWGRGIGFIGIDTVVPSSTEGSRCLDYGVNVRLIKSDALSYLREVEGREKFDYVCVDLWVGTEVVDYVCRKEFIRLLSLVAKDLVSINVSIDSKVKQSRLLSFDRRELLLVTKDNVSINSEVKRSWVSYFNFLRSVTVGTNEVLWFQAKK